MADRRPRSSPLCPDVATTNRYYARHSHLVYRTSETDNDNDIERRVGEDTTTTDEDYSLPYEFDYWTVVSALYDLAQKDVDPKEQQPPSLNTVPSYRTRSASNMSTTTTSSSITDDRSQHRLSIASIFSDTSDPRNFISPLDRIASISLSTATTSIAETSERRSQRG